MAPGIRAIVTKLAAYIGDDMPSPGEHVVDFVQNFDSTRPREFESMLSACLYAGCYKCHKQVVAQGTVLDQRNALITGMVLPLMAAVRSKTLYSCIFENGATWSLYDGVSYTDACSQYGKPRAWVKDPNMDAHPMILASNAIKYSIEPECPHWHTPLMDFFKI